MDGDRNWDLKSLSFVLHTCPSAWPQGAVITPAAAIEPSLSLHPSTVMAPLTQQMNHLSLGTTGTVSHLQISCYCTDVSLRMEQPIENNNDCGAEGCESVRRCFNSRHPRGPTVCLCSNPVCAPPSLCSTCPLQLLLLCKEPTFPSTLQCLPLPSQWK